MSRSNFKHNLQRQAADFMARNASPRSLGLKVVKRDVCVGCGVRQDKHGEFGCKRWRPTP